MIQLLFLKKCAEVVSGADVAVFMRRTRVSYMQIFLKKILVILKREMPSIYHRLKLNSLDKQY